MTGGKDMVNVAENLAAIRDRVAAACLAAGRSPDDVRLVAVSKRIDLELVTRACLAGHSLLGENRLPEAVDRQGELATALRDAGGDPDAVEWHFIGHIQSRKVPLVVGRFSLLHGVDSVRLARKINERCLAAGVVQPVLLEVNITAEEQKHGLAVAEVGESAEAVQDLPGLRLDGFMCMGRAQASPQELTETFATLNHLAAEARRRTGAVLPELSMGMSGDFELAIAQGATLIRVGSAIFGPRH
jgi:pyridoxal phosphate enzyme (YggS family)